MDFILEFHHFEDEDLQVRADGHFGIVDCFQRPQGYDELFPHTACIPHKESFPFPHPLHWVWFTPNQDDFIPVPGNSFPVGTLAQDKVQGLQSLLKLTQGHIRDYRLAYPDRGTVVHTRVLSLRNAIIQLKTHPLTFCDLLIFVTDAQHLFLDIYSYIDFINIVQPQMQIGDKCTSVNLEWMGAFMESHDNCNKLFTAGIPVWYVHARAYIPPNMTVIKPVLLTCPDQIVISMFMDGRKVHPFEVIHRGKGGRNCHIQIRWLYAGTTSKDPESDILSQPSCSSSNPPASGKAPPQKRGKQKNQPYSLGARPAHSAQSGESRDKWKDPETPYLPPVNLHWDYAMKNVIKTQSRVHTPYVIDRGYRFPKPALLLSPKLPERLQAYLANWLPCRSLWIGQINHDPLCNYPSPQVWQDFLGSPTVEEKQKLVMRNLFGDDLLDTQGDTFSSEGVVEFRGEQISVTSLASPPVLLIQKITWELFELGFWYELKDLDRYLAWACWADDPVGREELLHGIFPGEAGLLMWSEPFPLDNYGLWNNMLWAVFRTLKISDNFFVIGTMSRLVS
ncbi:hypothetical protein AZE42_11760 [Rhizopogon vesiculosus]|uniref:Uncharacterized protein n=1 Tax=Rhizopogon vesiculosus TaxID=180088 RepID=A0A1J8Q6E9_9AGAM|nr:hypothetical protein AZE42_11760 [Rhizopogon vesiculosus]